MRKIYKKPSIVVEIAVLTAVLGSQSEGTIPIGGSNGDDSNGDLTPSAKHGGSGSFDVFDDEDGL